MNELPPELRCRPWLAKPWEQLNTWLVNKHLAHAIVLTGASGLGKSVLACALSAKLLGAGATHPDHHEIPQGAGVDAIRDLTHKINQTAHNGGYQVVIIHAVHTLNIAASNALLKLLEEPPAARLFLLLSDEPGQILPTIASRCQVLTCPLAKRAETKAYLAKAGINVAEIEKLVAYWPESPEKALSIWQSEQLADVSLLAGKFHGVLNKKSCPVEAAKPFAKHDWPFVLNSLQTILSQYLSVHYAYLPYWSLWDKLIVMRRSQHRPLNQQLQLEDFFITVSCA